mmetsp:Transcript_666/g.792  ORF Transcript_666/g.792 Transcript_666/m.792 type:complete len:84 (+) Transcript_666:2185-2436(+)
MTPKKIAGIDQPVLRTHYGTKRDSGQAPFILTTSGAHSKQQNIENQIILNNQRMGMKQYAAVRGKNISNPSNFEISKKQSLPT